MLSRTVWWAVFFQPWSAAIHIYSVQFRLLLLLSVSALCSALKRIAFPALVGMVVFPTLHPHITLAPSAMRCHDSLCVAFWLWLFYLPAFKTATINNINMRIRFTPDSGSAARRHTPLRDLSSGGLWQIVPVSVCVFRVTYFFVVILYCLAIFCATKLFFVCISVCRILSWVQQRQCVMLCCCV